MKHDKTVVRFLVATLLSFGASLGLADPNCSCHCATEDHHVHATSTVLPEPALYRKVEAIVTYRYSAGEPWTQTSIDLPPLGERDAPTDLGCYALENFSNIVFKIAVSDEDTHVCETGVRYPVYAKILEWLPPMALVEETGENFPIERQKTAPCAGLWESKEWKTHEGGVYNFTFQGEIEDDHSEHTGSNDAAEERPSGPVVTGVRQAPPEKPSVNAALRKAKMVLPEVVITRDIAGGADEYQPLTEDTRVVLPGQKIRLKAELRGTDVAAQSWAWTLPEAIFKDYAASQEKGTLSLLGDGDKDDQTVDFYWADSADNREVACKAQVGGEWFQGKDIFQVKKPVCALTTTLGTVRLDRAAPPPPQTCMGLFGDEDSRYGITYAASVEVPGGFGVGRWNFVQLVTPAQSRVRHDDTKQQWNQNGNEVLDTRYPFAPRPIGPHPGNAGSWSTSAGHLWADEPNTPVNPALKSVTVDNETFRTFVMFLPSGADSRYVPVQVITWKWRGKAILGRDGVWRIVAGSAGQGVTSPSEISSHPQWSDNVKNGTFVNMKNP